jgi:AcrR family transcriptional regulator
MLKRKKTKQRILESAVSLFKEKGIQNVTVEEIVTRSNMAKGSFFYHFSNKDQIVYDIINIAFEGYFNNPKQIVHDRSLTANEKLEQVLSYLFSAFTPPEDIEQIFQQGISLQYEQYINELRLKELIPLMSSIIEQGNSEGIFHVRNVEIISSLINRGITGYIHHHFANFQNHEAFQMMLSGIEELINKTLGTNKESQIKIQL